MEGRYLLEPLGEEVDHEGARLGVVAFEGHHDRLLDHLGIEGGRLELPEEDEEMKE